MNRYVGVYREDTVDYIKKHLEKIDEEIETYQSGISSVTAYLDLLRTKSITLIALANISDTKEL